MIQAIHRPRHGDVMLIDDAGEHYAVPLADIPALIAALHEAAAIPARAAYLQEEKR